MLPEVRIIKYATCICMNSVGKKLHLSRGGYYPGGGGGGYSKKKNWVGVCGPLPKTLTLFMTKICDFPYPIYDLI